MLQGIANNDSLVFLLGAVGLLWYYLCLFSVGLKPSPANQPPSGYRQFETLSITTISTSLATFVGSLMGLQSAATQVTEDIVPVQVPLTASSVFKEFTSSLSVSDLQWACAGLYVFSLILGIVFWARGRDKTDPVISNLGKSLLGLVGGALAIALRAAGK